MLFTGMADVVTSSERGVADIVCEAWEQVFRVPADRGDRILEVLDIDYGVTAAQQLSMLLSKIGSKSGVHLPLTIIYSTPTAGELTEMVQQRHWPRYDRPVRLKHGVGQPLFILPGLGAIGLDLLHLLEALTFSGPIYLSTPRGVDGADPDSAMDAIVADHLVGIRAIQPHGPYRLLGYSWGGLVALEIARILGAENQRIAFLGMIEPVLDELDWTYGAFIGFMKKRLAHHVQELRKIKSVSGAIRYGADRLVPLLGRTGRIFGFKQWDTLSGEAEKFPAPLDTVCQAEIKAIAAYRLSPYPGEVTLFATQSGHAALCDPRKVWSGKVGRLDLIWLSGDHFTILTKPGVINTAQVISERLQMHLV